MGLAVAVLPVDGAPQVGITVTGLDPVVSSVISVEVSWDGGESWHGVRGAERVTVTGAGFFRDFVPPLNVEATYRVVVHSGPELLPTVTRRNLVTNPSFEVDTSGWTGGGGVLSRYSGASPPWWPGHPEVSRGGYSALVTADGTSPYLTLAQSAGAQFPVTPGKWVGVTALVATDALGTHVARGARVDVALYGTGATQYAASGAFEQSVFYTGRRVVYAFQVPATVAGGRVRVQAFSGSTGISLASGQRMWADAIMTAEADTEAEALAAVQTYIDGATLDAPPFTYEWEGAANASASVEMAVVSQDTITVPSDTAWIQDPLDPRGAVAVDAGFDTNGDAWLLAPTSSTVNRGQVYDSVTVEGSRYPVASVGMRQAPSRVPISLRAAAQQGEMVRALRGLFDSSGILVLRGMHPDCPLDPVAHIVAGDITEAPKADGLYGIFNTWDLVVDQVRPTSMKVAIAYYTYNQVHALWQAWESGASYDDVIATRPGDLYIDWQRDPEVP